MPAGIFLLAQDIQQLRAVSERQAYRIYREVKETLGKENAKRVTLEDYATYEMVPIETIKKALNVK